MASVYDLKKSFQNLLRPIVLLMAAAGATANQVTIAAALLSVGAGALLTWGNRWWFATLPLVLFTRMALNAVDGMLAREHNQKSKFGALLNELCDVISDAALYLPFALVHPGAGALVAWIVVAAALTELAGVLGQTIGATRRYDGPMGKSDRATVFGALGLWIGFNLPLSATGYRTSLSIILALLILTIVRRCQSALRESK